MDPGLTVKATLLQALLEGPCYGQQLIALVHDRTGGRVRLGEGSLYPALRALEREGLVRSWDIRVPNCASSCVLMDPRT